jgi:large subunit ribosomal protein L23Ae
MSGKGKKVATTEKALGAAKSARVGGGKKKTKVRSKVHFYRPKTKLGGAKKPMYNRSIPKAFQRSDDPHAVVKSPLTSESAMKKIEENNTLVFLVASMAKRPQIKAAVEKVRACAQRRGGPPSWSCVSVCVCVAHPPSIPSPLPSPPSTQLYDIKVLKVNTLIRPDGVKKAYVKLTRDFDALDVANKIGII